MFRRLFWILLVIILVCLNWFKHLVAQDLSGLSEADKAALIARVQSAPAPGGDQMQTYRAAPIYDTPGHRIYVPTTPSGISVPGAVGASGTINSQKGKKAKHYIEHAGNFTTEADKGGVRLIRANGEMLSGGGTLGKHVDLGNVIVVPTKIQSEKNYIKTFTTTLSAVDGVLTTILLID